VGCREVAGREALVRLVLAPDNGLVIDARARLPGRGAWVHPRKACVAAVEAKPQLLMRALGHKPTTAGFFNLFRGFTTRSALDGLSQAQAAGALVGGRDLLTRAIREGRIEHVVVAENASERTIQELEGAAPDGLMFTRLPLDTGDLGSQVGKGPRAALGVRRSRAAAHLIRQLRRLRDLG
jgi:hypothetical protein